MVSRLEPWRLENAAMTKYQEQNGLRWMKECKKMTRDQLIEKAAFLVGLFCLRLKEEDDKAEAMQKGARHAE